MFTPKEITFFFNSDCRILTNTKTYTNTINTNTVKKYTRRATSRMDVIGEGNKRTVGNVRIFVDGLTRKK
jgi:hypothetical protein